MAKILTAVVENGALRPVEPLDLPEGEQVELAILDRKPSSEFERSLDALQAEARRYPAEWWDEFDRELQENRVNFEVRL